MTFELVPSAGPQSSAQLAQQLGCALRLDRAETRKLLQRAERALPLTEIVCGQLRSVLARKDWLAISVVADSATVWSTGLNIGIVQARAPKAKKSPMQKWQSKQGLRGGR